MMLGAGVIRATTLENYRERVGRAVQALDGLPQWAKVESEANYTRRVSATLQQVEEWLLPLEAVELNGTTLSLDNKWLAEALTRYQQIAVDDDARRAAELSQITERLKALNEHLAELAPQVQAAPKDEEKKKLEGILRRPEYNTKPDEGSALGRLWQRFVRWWRDLFPKQSELAPGTSKTFSGLAQLFVISLALAVIGYILWKFTPLFRRGAGIGGRSTKPEARIVLGERLAANQTSADLLAEAEALARAGELRAAIRKGYIALLCELGDRKIIGLAQHKTNRDYLRAVNTIEPLHGQMQQLTQSFENHWYGFVPATLNDWNAFRSGFERAVTSDK